MKSKLDFKKVNFRKAIVPDLKDLFEIGKANFGDQKWLTAKFLEDSLLEMGYHYVAECKGDIIGGIMVTKYDFPKNWIFYMVVHPEYQRQGIGSAILKLVENDVSNNPPKNDSLYVDIGIEKEDIPARNFYLKNGFKNEGRVENWFDDGMPALILRKSLK
ncbi:GNAT family N-acetyltransferase [Patescibacteria group bacterium]|nr:GNAT family N-acetyltransferase [Patescibacteria group bacterium]MBU4000406.1 GNAT family N-acetyltransferase [Patescibacteria group bacterium]MBU4056472.1 GNAT family N-acetyltransferase [Patescibacteria group bacterium]MBU4368542.1 GNAT family N-acetyltransferase [Patescibacteria group bacterium]